jgi:hypothetical protein
MSVKVVNILLVISLESVMKHVFTLRKLNYFNIKPKHNLLLK